MWCFSKLVTHFRLIISKALKKITIIAALKQIFIYFSFAFLMVLGYLISRNLEAIEETTSWYLPAGIRLVAYLYLGRKYWPTVLFSEISLYTYMVDWVHLGAPHLYLLAFNFSKYTSFMVFISPVITMLASFYIKCKKITIFDFYGAGVFVFILSLMTFFQSFLKVLVQYLNLEFNLSQSVEALLGYWVGDFIGCFIVISCFYILLGFNKTKALTLELMDFVSFVMVLVFGCFLFGYSFGYDEQFYFFKLFAFLLAPIMIYRNQLRGAMISIIGVFFSLIFLEPEFVSFWDLQVYILALLISSLLTGSAFETIKQKNIELTDNVRSLERINNENQRLTAQVSATKEKERERLAKELHDDVGQSIIALKTEVKIGEKLNVSSDFLDILRLQIDQVYTSVYQILFQLRPRELAG